MGRVGWMSAADEGMGGERGAAMNLRRTTRDGEKEFRRREQQTMAAEETTVLQMMSR